MKLHYAKPEIINKWSIEEKIGYWGWNKRHVATFREKQKNLIGVAKGQEEKAKNLAESLFAGIIPAGLKKVLVGRLSSFDMWYSFSLLGEEISFGLNTRIPFETIDKIEWI